MQVLKAETTREREKKFVLCTLKIHRQFHDIFMKTCLIHAFWILLVGGAADLLSDSLSRTLVPQTRLVIQAAHKEAEGLGYSEIYRESHRGEEKKESRAEQRRPPPAQQAKDPSQEPSFCTRGAHRAVSSLHLHSQGNSAGRKRDDSSSLNGLEEGMIIPSIQESC